MAEGELVEAGLQVLGADRAQRVPKIQRFRSEIVQWQPCSALPLRRRAFVWALDDPLTGPLAQAVAVVAGQLIRHDPRLGRNLAPATTASCPLNRDA